MGRKVAGHVSGRFRVIDRKTTLEIPVSLSPGPVGMLPYLADVKKLKMRWGDDLAL